MHQRRRIRALAPHQINEAGHPIPDRRGVAGAKRIAQIASEAGPDDLVLCLISGGASALLPLPAPPDHARGKTRRSRDCCCIAARTSTRSTASANTSRAIKGGRLARLAYPATVFTLILSDVIGDDLDVIGSGPTVPDRTTFAGREGRSSTSTGLESSCQEVRALSARPGKRPNPETGSSQRSRNVIVGSNRAGRGCRGAGRPAGSDSDTWCCRRYLEGEAREVARVYAGIAKEIRAIGQARCSPRLA